MTTIKRLALLLCFGLLLTASTYAAGNMSIFAGKGSAGGENGELLTATFRTPYGLCLDTTGNLLVADSYNNLIRKLENGQVSTLAGKVGGPDAYGYPQGGLVDGSATQSLFNRPRGLAVDAQGNLFVADTQNHVIRKVDNGQVRTFAGNGQAGSADGKGREVQFNSPSGLAVDEAGNIYVADTLNHVVRQISPAGDVVTFAGVASTDGAYVDGAAAAARFNEPAALAIAPDGALLVADAGNQLIRKIFEGRVTTLAGQFNAYPEGELYATGGFVDGPAQDARFNFPKGLCVAENGVVFVADTWNHAIRAITLDGMVVTIALKAEGVNVADQLMELNGPVGLAYMSGKLHIADQWANVIRVLSVDPANLQPVTADDPPEANEQEQDDERAKPQQPKPIEFDPDTSVVQVWVDSNRVIFPDTKPYIATGRTMVPLRFICEQWGAEVGWDEVSKVVTVTKGEFQQSFSASPGRLSYRNGRAMVGLRFLAESFDFSVDWVEKHKAVVIDSQQSVGGPDPEDVR